MRLTGSTYQAIADQMGYANRGTVYRLVTNALQQHEMETVEELRQLEIDRLDDLQACLWTRAMVGDLAAAAMVLKIIEQRCRIEGLYTLRDSTRTDNGTVTQLW
jgi:hypothetical protein